MNSEDAADIGDFIRECFNHNFEFLKAEGGGSIAPEVRQTALNQVLLYWRKLRQIADRVTDTEVPIHLPNQTTPDGRAFGIEGVVDIIREDDLTLMYDIKTHDADYVRTHTHLYEMQLNLYAYVWQQLRGEPLDGTAIIATGYPESVRDTLPPGKLADELTEAEDRILDAALKVWEPLIEITLDDTSVQETIRKFGEVVDRIESGEFAPPPLETLKEKWQSPTQTFATRVCRNCDARFSCASYRAYAQQATGWRMMHFARFFHDDIPPSEQEGWVAATLNASAEDAYIDALLGEE
ncbi:MAG: PD-(D/E)XK nuclease family protein [Anaerolinea sp.]|nr:PD-(D/E)XK nuclease family protein [Anaerolinea sp.]